MTNLVLRQRLLQKKNEKMATAQTAWQTVTKTGNRNNQQRPTGAPNGPNKKPPTRREDDAARSRSNPNVIRVYVQGPQEDDGNFVKELMTRENWDDCFSDLQLWIKHYSAIHRGAADLRAKIGIDNHSYSVDKNQPRGEGEKGSGFLLLNTDSGVDLYLEILKLVSVRSAAGTIKFLGEAQRDDSRPFISFQVNPAILRHESPRDILTAVEDAYPNLKARQAEIVKINKDRKTTTVISVKTSDEYLRMLRGVKMLTETRCGRLPWNLSARDKTREKEAEKARALAIIEGVRPPVRPRWTTCTSDPPTNSGSQSPPPGGSRSSSTASGQPQVPWQIRARALRDAEIQRREEAASSSVEEIDDDKTPSKTPAKEGEGDNANKRQRIDRTPLRMEFMS